MKMNTIKERVVGIIENQIGRKITQIPDYSSIYLLGTEMNVKPRELVKIVVELEKIFQIQFTELDFLRKRFLRKRMETIDLMVDVIQDHLQY